MILVYAISLSMALHFILLYTPILQTIFSIVPLDMREWSIVIAWSVPIIFIDEILKAIERVFVMGKVSRDDILKENEKKEQ